ncbi:unnamed protein product [Miscanthus lutarioriparius]|uniref:TF-B3 domain-containing protein n=1 Tax=Miscanthus lutarioriparius TaxID=422564 RepID=A0A811MWB3_9POAL|nr:unnamed protein product [Miscanthus lutarioriparius]
MAGQGSQVKKSCACCERYMDHWRGKMTSFLMLMSANYRHSMTMPARFMNQFGGEISESIDIESPDGSVYVVKGTKFMNKMLPQCGWKAFVDAHRIEENDSLLFQHIEKARFKIGPMTMPTNHQEFGKESLAVRGIVQVNVEKLQGLPQHQPLRLRNQLCTGPDSEGTAEYECSSGFDDDPKTNAAPDYVLSCMTIPSEEQEEEVDGLIKEIQPETTVFVAIMKPSNVKRYSSLNQVIPHGYAAAHFPHTSQVVTLQRPGKNKKWHTKLQVRKDRVSHVFRVRLRARQPFAGRRHLHLSAIEDCWHKSKVGALPEHAGNSPSPGPGGGTSSSKGRTTRTKANEPKIVHSGEGSRAKAKVTPVARVKEEPADQAPSPCNCHLTDDESGDSGGPSKAGLYIMASHAHLGDEQRKKVEDVVGSIQSQVPLYVAVMSKTNVAATGCVLYFGKQYASKYLPYGEHTVTLMRNGKSSAWKVKMHAQRFSKGWRGFVRDNRLKLDDICLFQLTKDDIKMLTMTVYIIRHV